MGSRVWLVTGASGGLSRAPVSEILRSGERVLAVMRHEEPLRPLTAAFRASAHRERGHHRRRHAASRAG